MNSSSPIGSRASAAQPSSVPGGPDRTLKALRVVSVFLLVSILTLVLYALVTGVMKPPAPRTVLESAILQAEAAVDANPRNGRAWGQLAGAQYATGDTKRAWKTIGEARRRVNDRSILHVNNQELNFLILEGRNKEAVKRADTFLRTEVKAQMEEKAELAGKSVAVPDQRTQNPDSVRLVVLKGTAQGNLGQWKDAVKTFDIALQLDDRAADILTLRGWAKLRSGDAAGARKDFERVLIFMPKDTSAIEGLAEAKAAQKSK